MLRSWSFGRVVGAGLLFIAALTLLCSVVSITALRAVVADKDGVISVNASRRLSVETLRMLRERRARYFLRYLMSRDDVSLQQMRAHQAELAAGEAALRSTAVSARELELIDQLAEADVGIRNMQDQLSAARQGGASAEQVSEDLVRIRGPRVDALEEALNDLASYESTLLFDAQRRSTERSNRAGVEVAVIAALASAVAAFLAISLGRFLRRRVGAVIQDVEGSSGELQIAANQQVKSAERLTTVTAEVTTTIQELLATSRQISESAQRVTLAAEEATAGAGAGDGTVQRTQEAIVGIKRQVDLIVSHMLDLDRKFQEIGAILDLIREFTEQTNILSINATIEAAGAGAAGKRFAVVADEIQRLADRVGGSTREIYQLIHEIRAAASATMLATEDGKKAVDSGARQFNEVLSTFKQIAVRSAVTAEAAREIELSTKQQTSAVEQVSQAISDVSQAAHDTQLSSAKTLTTSEQLAGISRKLTQIVRPASSPSA